MSPETMRMARVADVRRLFEPARRHYDPPDADYHTRRTGIRHAAGAGRLCINDCRRRAMVAYERCFQCEDDWTMGIVAIHARLCRKPIPPAERRGAIDPADGAGGPRLTISQAISDLIAPDPRWEHR